MFTTSTKVHLALEPLVGKFIAERATDDDRAALSEAFDKVREIPFMGDAKLRLRAKDQYYDVLVKGARNEEIGRMLRSVNARIQLLRTHSMTQDGRAPMTVQELGRNTTAAVDARDANLTRDLCAAHVLSATGAALRGLED